MIIRIKLKKIIQARALSFAVFIFGFFLNYSANTAYILEVNEAKFQQEIEELKQPVFIKISAKWCPNCKRLEQMITELMDQFKDSCVFANIDIDKNQSFLQNLLQDIFQKHCHIIAGFPSILVFSKGVFISSFFGYFATKEDLKKKINEVLAQLTIYSNSQ
jgi:thioredoxin-like negative regulator of GroEL